MEFFERQITDQGGSSVDVEFLSNPLQGKVSAGMISVSAAKNGDEYCGDFYFEELNERREEKREEDQEIEESTSQS